METELNGDNFSTNGVWNADTFAVNFLFVKIIEKKNIDII